MSTLRVRGARHTLFRRGRRSEGERAAFPTTFLPPTTPVVLSPPGPSRIVRSRQSATEGPVTDCQHFRCDGNHHDVHRGCWRRREVARQPRVAISWPQKGERRRPRRRRLHLRRQYLWLQQRVRLRRHCPRRLSSTRSSRTSAHVGIDSWQLSIARRVEYRRRTGCAVSATICTRCRLD